MSARADHGAGAGSGSRRLAPDGGRSCSANAGAPGPRPRRLNGACYTGLSPTACSALRGFLRPAAQHSFVSPLSSFSALVPPAPIALVLLSRRSSGSQMVIQSSPSPRVTASFASPLLCSRASESAKIRSHAWDFRCRVPTRNRTAEVLPVPTVDSPEVPERGGELLRFSEGISGRRPQRHAKRPVAAQARSILVASVRSWGEAGRQIGTS